MQRAAVFLDRDGTLNEEVGYLSRPEDLVLIPGAGEAVRRINQAGMAAVVRLIQAEVAPVVSLYVNEWNTAARAAYERVGFRETALFSTVMF